jgi:hypothetical protein
MYIDERPILNCLQCLDASFERLRGYIKAVEGEGSDSLPRRSHCIDEADRLSSEGLLLRAGGAVLRSENDFR